MMNNNLDLFFAKFKIIPNNKDIYLYAFTHSSCNENNLNKVDYERLEFMGDSVVGFVVASLIFKHYKNMSEGEMTKLRSVLVCRKSLANKTLRLDLIEYIRVGNSITRNELINNEHILEDVFEAMIGAIYIDLGLEFVIKFVTNLFIDDVINFKSEYYKDYKSILQEALQAEYRGTIVYNLINSYGPPHDPTFEVNVTFNNQILGKGKGKSKKEAEQLAAKDALSKVCK